MGSPDLNVERSTSTAHRLYHYDGACNSVHGHNLMWEVGLDVKFSQNGEDNMSIDFKEVSSLVDEVDHATLLNFDDPLAENRADWTWIDGNKECPVIGWTRYSSEVLGDVFLFEGDPTVEVVSEWMGYRFVNEYSSVVSASISLAETENYTYHTEVR